MSPHLILAIESIASLIAFAYTIKKPVTIPLFFLFLNILFSSQYLGKFNIPTIIFLVPALITFCLLNYQKLSFSLLKENLNVFLIFSSCVIAISMIHFVVWQQLPWSTLKNSLLAMCFAPFLLQHFKENKINDFINTGAFLFGLATLILLPQALKFYLSTPELSLGRKVSGGFALNHPAVQTWAILPTVSKGDQILSSFFSLKEVPIYYYISLSSIFFTYVFLKFFIAPLKLTAILVLSFLLIYVSQYVNLMLAFHVQLFVATILIYFYRKDKISYKSNLSTFILLISLNFSAFALTLSNPSLEERVVNTYYSSIGQRKSRYQYALSATNIKDFYLTSVLNRVSSHQGRNISRIARIKTAFRLLLNGRPFLGIGDPSRDNLKKITKDGIDKFSNHSFITDVFVSFGLFCGAIFLFIPFLYLPIQIIKNMKSRNLAALSVGVFLSLSLINSSFLGTFGIQPFQLGFILFTISFLNINLKHEHSFISHKG